MGKTWFKSLPSFAVFRMLLFPAPLSLGHSFLFVITPSSLFFFSLFSSFLPFSPFVSTRIISEFMEGYPVCLSPYKFIPSSFIPTSLADPNIFPWH